MTSWIWLVVAASIVLIGWPALTSIAWLILWHPKMPGDPYNWRICIWPGVYDRWILRQKSDLRREADLRKWGRDYNLRILERECSKPMTAVIQEAERKEQIRYWKAHPEEDPRPPLQDRLRAASRGRQLLPAYTYKNGALEVSSYAVETTGLSDQEASEILAAVKAEIDA